MESPLGARRKNRASNFVREFARILVVVSAGVLFVACTQTQAFLSETEIPERSGTLRVLLMPPDVEVSEISAAGRPEPKADWTASARKNVEAALDAILAERDARLVRYRSASGDS